MMRFVQVQTIALERDGHAGCRGVVNGLAIAVLLWIVLALLIWRALS